MAWITDNNREKYIKIMDRHFKRTITEEQLRKNIEKDPTILDEFVDYLENHKDERYLGWVKSEALL